MDRIDASGDVALWKCRRCQRIVRTPLGSTGVRAPCQAGPSQRHPLQCDHIGNKIGDVELRRHGCGCGPREASVFECDLFGQAAPFARGLAVDPQIADCLKCGKYLEAL